MLGVISDQLLFNDDFFLRFKVTDESGNKGRGNAFSLKKFKVLNFSAGLFRVDLFADFETRKLVI